MCAEGEVLSAKTAIDAVCTRHGVPREELQEHFDTSDLDIKQIDKDAAHVQQVQSQLQSTYDVKPTDTVCSKCCPFQDCAVLAVWAAALVCML